MHARERVEVAQSVPNLKSHIISVSPSAERNLTNTNLGLTFPQHKSVNDWGDTRSVVSNINDECRSFTCRKTIITQEHASEGNGEYSTQNGRPCLTR